jgi:glycosyltransferase involved in cell wall biosynthesis
MTRRILRGFRRAAVVVCASEASRDDAVRLKLTEASRLRVVPNGIDPAFLDEPSQEAQDRAAALLPAQRGVVDVLHVGSDIPRKRIDRVIDIVATLRKRGRWVRLVRVGAPFRPEHRQRIADLVVNDVVELPFLERDVLRAVYGRCDVLLLTSDREGYGLPVIEAFAAGKPVVASDIPALRETAGGLATLVRPDALPDWVAAVERAITDGDPDGALGAARRAHAAGLTWNRHVLGLLPIYEELLAGIRGAPR